MKTFHLSDYASGTLSWREQVMRFLNTYVPVEVFEVFFILKMTIGTHSHDMDIWKFSSGWTSVQIFSS